jgi:hypothetical protein
MAYSDIVGYDEIIGALDELDSLDRGRSGVGATLAIGDEIERLMSAAGADAPSRLQELARTMRMAREVDPRAVSVVDRPATRRREYPLGFESTSISKIAPGMAGIDPGNTEVVRADPQISFRGERLVIPSDISLFFSIDDIIVGKNSQFVSSGPVPASTFSEVAVGVRLNLDTANVGNLISLRIRNIGPDPLVFRATLIGTGVE